MIQRSDNSLKEEIFKLEDKLLQPAIRNSTDELSNLLSDSFIEFGSSGRIYSKQQILDELPSLIHLVMKIKNFEIKKLSNKTILATYLLLVIEKGETEISHSMRSSIWESIDNNWQMIFHQGTLLKYDK